MAALKPRPAPAKPAPKVDRGAGTRSDQPHVSVDIAIFSIIDEQLQVLLVERTGHPDSFRGHWALPGGLVHTGQDTDLQACAHRHLRTKTGVESPYLEQVGTWGNARRDPRSWTVTTLYFALIRQNLAPRAGGNSSDVRWHPVDHCPKLAFDHVDLLAAALKRLRNKVNYSVLPTHLMPETFTLPELQHAFEIVLDRKLDHSAFRTRIVNADVLLATGQMRRETRRPSQLYRLKPGANLLLDSTFRKP